MANYVKVGMEAVAYGTPAASYTSVLVTNTNPTDNRNIMQEVTTSSYLPQSAWGGALKLSGSIEGNLRPNQMENLIYALFGAQADHTTYKTYTLDVPTSVTIKIGEDTSETLETVYTGGGITSASFNFAASEFVKATFNYIASDNDAGTFDAAVTWSEEKPIVFYRAYVTVAGDDTVGVKSLTMDIDRGIDADQFVLGNFHLYRLARTSQTAVTGTITFTENEFTELKRAMYGSTSGTSIGDDNALGRASLIIECQTVDGDAAMIITVPVIVFSQVSRTFDGTNEVVKEIEYTAIVDADTDFKIDIYDYTTPTLTASFTHVEVGLTSTFTDASTADAGAEITYWHWNFGDGEVSYEQNPSHTYASGSTYTVVLTVDGYGASSDTDTQSVTVSS